MTRPPPRESEQGMALLAVILALLVISVLALGMVLATRSGVDDAQSDLLSSQARAFSDGVILQTAVLLLAGPPGPRVDGVPQTLEIMGQPVTVAVTSEFGKVDLNAADAGTLTNLLEAAGEGPATATELAGNILTWRGGADGIQIHPFRAVTELNEVPGITASLYATLAPAITVYNGSGRIDNSTAPLLALQANGMDHLSAAALLRARNSMGSTASFGEIAGGHLQSGVTITGWAFDIEADYTLGPRAEHLSAVIRMTGDPSRPYLLLWLDQLPI